MSEKFDPKTVGRFYPRKEPIDERVIGDWDVLMPTDNTKAKAESGDAESQFRLGFMYDVGLGCDEDPEKAEIWYCKAANGNHPDALFHYGVMVYEKAKTNADVKEALSLWKRAATRGHVLSQLYLGYMYENGKGMFWKSRDAAIYWYNRAATQGNPAAMIQLGDLHQNMFSLFSDNKKIALNWYNKASGYGDEEAKNKFEELTEKMRGNETLHQKTLAYFDKKAKALEKKIVQWLDFAKQSYGKSRKFILRVLKPVRKRLYTEVAKAGEAKKA